MPNLTGPQTRAQMADRARTPAKAASGGGHVITVNLRFSAGKQFVPEDLFDALEAKYGSGKVLAERDTTGPGTFNLNIVP